MAIGRTFKEALQKGLRGLEIGASGLPRPTSTTRASKEKLLHARPRPHLLREARAGARLGARARSTAMTGIDPWFLDQIQQIVDLERHRVGRADPSRSAATLRAGQAHRLLRRAPRPARWARREAAGARAAQGRRHRARLQARRHLRGRVRVAHALPLLDLRERVRGRARPTAGRCMILGSGPNRIGQGIEFDYCCCHGAFAFKEEGYETIMVNCNPETVSTDYDTSDRLYFEPLTFEDVMNIVELEKPEGVVIQFGGQTPLKLALPLHRAGVQDPGHEPRRHRPGRGPQALQRAARRARHPPSRRAAPPPRSRRRRWWPSASATRCWCGPRYVLGGRAMAIVYDDTHLEGYVREAVKASPEHPILVDRFLEDAYEVDVDALGDGERVVIGGILQHIEEAGIHSGDSAMVLPTYKIAPEHLETIRRLHARAGPGPRGARPDERAVRDQGRRGLRAGGQPARLAHHAVREQGHRRAAGQGGRAHHGRTVARRAGPHRGPHGRRASSSRSRSSRS